MIPKATNNYVWLIRDAIAAEKSGIIIPGTAREKPHTGTVVSIGSLVKDKEIKASKGKKALFHKGVEQEIEYADKVYIILNELHIIGID
jgi:chaperonin GroES